MAVNNSIFDYQLTSGGGTLNLDSKENYNAYRFFGTATLSSSWTIQPSGSYLKGLTYYINYEASLNLNGNILTLFGVSIPSDIAANNFEAICVYNGSSWDVTIKPDFSVVPVITESMVTNSSITTSKIANNAVDNTKLKSDVITDSNRAVTTDHLRDSSVTSNKIANGAITTSKLDSANKLFMVIVPVSFESGEQADNTIEVPFNCRVTKVFAVVTKAISATDIASIEIDCNGSRATPSSLNFSASTVINTLGDVIVTGGNTVLAGQKIKLISSKVTPGGKALVTLYLERL
jgi:hypothetical protein